ncbi:hypothetical protein HMPREF0663_11546 [Hoylesella oralis ATCC 33269]|uniref:Uncharacterized protein n=1 Tax=Hoylesella oralis ATCC 33269 TaxID=873533 RepID=E7RQU5_9BACT|nr:hypothetical protein HMPREF0663_11546 [Hoylesella oralis ATCC 33269]
MNKPLWFLYIIAILIEYERKISSYDKYCKNNYMLSFYLKE